MMLRPSEYIAAAMRNVRAQMGDCAMTLRIGDRIGSVTRIGSPSIGEGEAAQTVTESVRALASLADFPDAEKDDAACLDGVPRLVTSTRTDPSRTTLFIGFGAAMDERKVAVHSATGARLADTLPALVTESEEVPNFDSYGARGTERVFTCVIRECDWLRPERPDVGDVIRMDANDDSRIGSVSSVKTHKGRFVLTVLERR